MIRDDVAHRMNTENGKRGGNPALLEKKPKGQKADAPANIWEAVLSEHERNVLKRLPGLRRHEDEPEAVKEIVRTAIVRYRSFPEVYAFINTALSQGYKATTISAALHKTFELGDARKLKGKNGQVANLFPFAKKLLENPELSATELNRLLAMEYNNIHSIGSLLKGIGGEKQNAEDN
jgi:hypothetical protein